MFQVASGLPQCGTIIGLPSKIAFSRQIHNYMVQCKQSNFSGRMIKPIQRASTLAIYYQGPWPSLALQWEELALILVTASIFMAGELARLVPQDIDNKRSTEAGGGFSLAVGSGNTCPSDTTQCNGYNCCPNSLTCHEGVASALVAPCCPSCKWPASTVAFHMVLY